MEEKYKNFSSFDWVNSDEWHTYFGNLYPAPPGNKVLYFKKKFYKLKIDSEFDLDYEPLDSEKPFEKIPERFVPTQGRKGLLDQFFACIEGFLIMTFFFAFSLGVFPNHPAFISLMIGCFRRVGMIKWSKDYLMNLLHNEEFQMIVYLLILYFYNKNFIFLYCPICLLLFLNVCEYFKFYLTIFKFLIKYFDNMLTYREYILNLKAKIEVLIALFFILRCFVDFYPTIITCIIYANYIRVKYLFNMYTSNVFGEFNRLLNRVKDHPKCPKLIITLIDQVKILGCNLIKKE
jgi:hypothetical protein